MALTNKQPMYATERDLRPKFHGSKQLRSKYIQLFPDSAERDMRRLSNSYMRMINKSMKEYLPSVMAAYSNEVRKDSRMDGLADLRKAITKMFGNVTSDVGKKAEDFELRKKIDRVATSIKNTALREWKKTVKKTLNIDVPDEHYKEEMYKNAILKWDDSVEDSFRNLPDEMMQRVSEIIEEGYRKGDSPTIVKVRIQNEYNAMKRRAASNAGANVSTLNYECTRKNQEDAGVTKYMWKSMRDAKVRPCHRALDGKPISWDDPPEMWYDTISRGRVYTGRRCHPGEDYNCRCCAVPIFDRTTLKIPVPDKKKEGVLIGNL